MAFIDYYKVLGVPKDIAQADVKKAYLKRAKQFHPDLHPDDPKAKAKFQALNEAYDVIGDPEKRRKYDQYGAQWKEADAFQAGGGFNWGKRGGSPFEGFDFSSYTSGGGFSSFFKDLFGGGATSGRRSSGRPFGGSTASAQDNGDTTSVVSIDLYTALLGGDVVVVTEDGSKVRLKVKPETQNGSKVRLRGKGRLRGDGTRGDMILTFQVTLPTHLSERQKTLLMEMRNA